MNNCAESPGSDRYVLLNEKQIDGRVAPAELDNGNKRRTQSVRDWMKPRMDFAMDEEFRPRVSSCPTRPRPRHTASTLHPLSASAENSNEDIYRVRCFTVSSKGDVVNRLDSIRSRSNRSINSTHSSSSMGSGSDCKEARAGGISPATMSRASTPHSEVGLGDNTPLHRVFILGSAGVGKTALVDQFMSCEYKNTYESDSPIDSPEKTVSVMLDGEESDIIFNEMTMDAFGRDITIVRRESDGYVIVYSITERTTFERAVDVLYTLHQYDEIKYKAAILVGNKSDLARSRVVSHEEAIAVAKTYACKLAEVSAGINHKVDELLVGVVKQARIKRVKLIEDQGAFHRKEHHRHRSGAKILLDKIFHNKHLPFSTRSCENLYTV
ncbi:PREDICTED: GTP-binding protein REM 1-like [Priapulus caudatus]|uniref:GTP-binding protein REM 1-like n=1 Tax=Priapulus caudatus TaxID=37621 RepID=A0ABM1F9D7_PRICU|nr:PREDICTED: GTP-binding protein REM 1-like [Priapulus caudatus]